MSRKESDFKHRLYCEIRERFPGTEVLPNDANYVQGIPDATVYFPNGRYVMLEGKRESTSSRRPNQAYYVEQSPLAPHSMFVYPANVDDVLSELERRYYMP